LDDRAKVIPIQPRALSILDEAFCLCLLPVIGSFDTKHQHQTTMCVCVSVHKTVCPQPSGKAEWERYSDVGLFLLPSSRTAPVSRKNRAWYHIVRVEQRTDFTQHKTYCATSTECRVQCQEKLDTKLGDESIILFTLIILCFCEGVDWMSSFTT
jgi:hypothetical protein